jgi:glycosyltransferase involved in cell wall biosynthesis
VTQDYPPGQNGGIARNISQFARSMAAEGHHIHVLTKAHGPSSVDYEDGVWVHRVAIRHFPAPSVSPVAPHVVPSHIWNYGQTMLEEVRAIDARRKIDVVYCPLWDCEPLAFVLDGQFPLMLALQTTMKFWLESQPLKAADPDWMKTFGYPILAMEELILERVKMMHANSRAIVNDIRAKYNVKIPEEKIFYSPHCMEDWAASLESGPSSSANVRMLFVGRLESRKGIDVVLKVAPALLTQFSDAILNIVGDDTIPRPDGTTYKQEFEALDLPSFIRDRIIFHGRVEEEELRTFYRDCDIFVAPSRYESFGLVFLEAMMFGKPVIGCDAGGGPEVVSDGKTGFLVKPGDADGLRDALTRLLANPDLRREMGAAARDDYERRFTETVMVGDLTNALNVRLKRRTPWMKA